MNPGYTKADINALPKVDFVMVQQFLATSDKFRNANEKGKIERSQNPDYLKSAVGKVQYKIDGSIYTIRARIVPEHKVTKRQYSVVAIINTADEEVIDVYCESESDGCKAAAGGCKHAVAFLFFLYDKYNQPSPTELSCLWKIPQLAKVDENIDNFDLAKCNRSGVTAVKTTGNDSGRFLQLLLEKCPEAQTNTFLKYHQSYPQVESYAMHCLILDFKRAGQPSYSCKAFVDYCKSRMVHAVCAELESVTKHQSACSKWHLLKFGRVSASKIYEASRCKTPDRSLVCSILGQLSISTEAMRRGLRLEGKVVTIIKKHYPNVRRCGFFLNPIYPTFGALPDAVNATTVFEIKSPSKKKNTAYYINDADELTDKVKSQIQLQMIIANGGKGVLVLVLPGFESSRKPEKFVQFHEEEQDVNYITCVMKDSYKFWAANVYDKLFEKF
ncbi:uncharacterized protein LOC129718692 [Wyeomyia smithii]|uniref:uncharacterized protein LOC129718692 n=1 Tax=Wyeomyia smithii TaxID=174621 RepID=UPI002467D1D1|nr:uncharacterized protein LOC129718692 [Wyeomyia smithii]